MARELAAATGESLTEAISRALEERLRRAEAGQDPATYPAPVRRISVASVIEIVPVDLEQCRIAQEAAVRFGRGRHTAALNYGDCFSYALAPAETLATPFP